MTNVVSLTEERQRIARRDAFSRMKRSLDAKNLLSISLEDLQRRRYDSVAYFLGADVIRPPR